MSTATRTASTAALAFLLTLGLTACQTATEDRGVPRSNGNPAQQYHAACD